MPHSLVLSFNETELGLHLTQSVAKWPITDGELDDVKTILGIVDVHDSMPGDGAADAVLHVPGGEIQVKVALVETE